MKQYKLLPKHTFFFFCVFSLISMFLCSSCNLFGLKVHDYLKEYTENAAIVKYELGQQYPVDKDGFVSVPSGNDISVRLILRNPQKYELDFNCEFETATTVKYTEVANLGTTPLEIAQASDASLVNLTYSKEFLLAMEQGGDISPLIKITEPKSQRQFQSFTYPLRVNTVPPQVGGTIVGKDAIENKYILCFNMPSTEQMKGIHQDITTIEVSNGIKTEQFTVSVNEGAGTFSLSSESSEKAVQARPSSLGFDEGFNFFEKGQPVYILTGDQITDENIFYTINVTDSKGLTSTVITSVKAVKLDPVSITDSNGTSVVNGTILSQDEDSSFATITISPPQNTADASIVYEVYSISESGVETLIKDGSTESGEVTIQVPPGKVRIVSYARKSLYVDSDIVSTSFSVALTRAYVSSSYTGELSTGDKDSPFTSLSDAFYSFEDTTNGDNTIILLTDLEDVNPFNLANGGNMKITSVGGDKTYKGQINVEDSGNLTLQNIRVEGRIEISAGATVILKTGAVVKGTGSVIGDNVVFLQSGAYLTVAENYELPSGFTYGACIKTEDGNDIVNTTVLKTETGVITNTLCNKFVLGNAPTETNNDGISTQYCIQANDAKTFGVIKKTGVDPSFDFDFSVNYSLAATKEEISTDSTERAVSINIKDKEGDSVIPSSATITLYQNGTSFAELGDGEGTATTQNGVPEIIIPEWLPAGNYQLYLEATIESKVYSGTCNLKITN